MAFPKAHDFYGAKLKIHIMNLLKYWSHNGYLKYISQVNYALIIMSLPSKLNGKCKETKFVLTSTIGFIDQLSVQLVLKLTSNLHSAGAAGHRCFKQWEINMNIPCKER